MIQILLWPRLGRSALGQHRLDSLKERHVVAYTDRFIMRHSQGEGLRQFSHCLYKTFFAILLRQDVFLRGRQEGKPFCR